MREPPKIWISFWRLKCLIPVSQPPFGISLWLVITKSARKVMVSEHSRWAEAQIQSAGVPELEVWLEAILTSDTLESLLNRH